MSKILEPMMSEEEISIIDNLIEKHQPKTCLEWGSGGSTVYFPAKHNCIESWIAVEHNEKWFKRVNQYLAKNTFVYLVEVHEYLVKPMHLKFDFILIDGLMRAECLMVAESLLNEGGIIIFHDSARAEYQRVLKEWSGKSEKLTDGEIPTKTFAHRGMHKLTK